MLNNSKCPCSPDKQPTCGLHSNKDHGSLTYRQQSLTWSKRLQRVLTDVKTVLTLGSSRTLTRNSLVTNNGKANNVACLWPTWMSVWTAVKSCSQSGLIECRRCLSAGAWVYRVCPHCTWGWAWPPQRRQQRQSWAFCTVWEHLWRASMQVAPQLFANKHAFTIYTVHICFGI